jgi:hypothetical protein
VQHGHDRDVSVQSTMNLSEAMIGFLRELLDLSDLRVSQVSQSVIFDELTARLF